MTSIVRKLMLFVLMAIAVTAWAQEGHEGDMHIGHIEGELALLEPEEITHEPYWLTVPMVPTGLGFFVTDVGIDFAHHDHEGLAPTGEEPLVKQVTLRQIYVSDRLFGAVEGEDVPIFGRGTVGELTLIYDPNDPETVHRHIVFVTDNPLPSIFQFQLVNGLDADGNPLRDSRVYTLRFEPVPEPASVTGLASGLVWLALRRRKR